MALSASLEELLKVLEKDDPEAAKAQRALWEKSEKAVKATEPYVLRQEDYNRKLNADKEALRVAGEREDWYKKAKPAHEKLLTDYDEAQKKIADLEKQVQAATLKKVGEAAGEGHEIDPKELVAAIRAELGDDIPTKATLDKLVSDKAAELVKSNYAEAEKKFYEETFPKAAKWQSEMTDAQISYFQEAGKKLDMKEFSEFLQKNKIASPAEGYERFLEPIRRKKDIDTEVKKQVDEELKKRGNQDFPGSSGPQQLGALQLRFRDRDKEDPLIPKSAELGDGSLALAAAAEFRTEGKL